MTWTPVTKPNSSDWQTSNPSGRTQYDQSDVFYDDPNVFYDGVNYNQWSDVTKPLSSDWTKVSKAT